MNEALVHQEEPDRMTNGVIVVDHVNGPRAHLHFSAAVSGKAKLKVVPVLEDGLRCARNRPLMMDLDIERPMPIAFAVGEVMARTATPYIISKSRAIIRNVAADHGFPTWRAESVISASETFADRYLRNIALLGPPSAHRQSRRPRRG